MTPSSNSGLCRANPNECRPHFPSVASLTRTPSRSTPQNSQPFAVPPPTHPTAAAVRDSNMCSSPTSTPRSPGRRSRASAGRDGPRWEAQRCEGAHPTIVLMTSGACGRRPRRDRLATTALIRASPAGGSISRESAGVVGSLRRCDLPRHRRPRCRRVRSLSSDRRSRCRRYRRYPHTRWSRAGDGDASGEIGATKEAAVDI
jgi:hypothetical protein